jgi:uncharacterized protein (TIGR03435 family)
MDGPTLRALLVDRFKLKVHREIREVPVYSLTLAKSGPQLKPFRKEVALFSISRSPLTLPRPGELFCGFALRKTNGPNVTCEVRGESG